MIAWSADASIGDRIIAKKRDVEARLRKLVSDKLAIERSYNEKIAAERKRLARLTVLYRRKCRCCAMVVKFDGYPAFGGRAIYVRRRCLNSAPPGDFVCGVHAKSNKRQAQRATEIEGCL